MGCLCSKESKAPNPVAEIEKEEDKDAKKVLVQVISPLPREEVIVGVGNINSEGSVRLRTKTTLEVNAKPVLSAYVEDDGKTIVIQRPKNGHQRRCLTMDLKGANVIQHSILSMPHGAIGEQVAAGWPSWLASVAGEAIQGWTPRSADSYEKICKIGQGTYSSVYRARDLENGHIVAMKKVRFVNMDPESVRFMAREITILRRLDHPNVMKLEALVTSRISDSLYLVFEYMEHDLAGLLASPKVKLTESQIKCYMKQLFKGLEHCHSRGVLHRDIKGSNLLVNNKGILKIGDFGLATSFDPNQKQPLTSRVVTLWYRAPELLLGATEYGVEIDMWSAGCILAELFAGKPIMPGRTEVEQMHKIFKLCGSPSDDYWKKTKLPHASSFKSQHMYMRRVADTFREFPSSALALVEVLLSIDPDERGTASSALKSEFFTSHPLPCEPSSLPKYHPSKELDAKIREEEAKRRKSERGKGSGAERERKSKATQEQGQTHMITSHMYTPSEEDSGAGFPIEPPRVVLKNGYAHSNSVIHPKAVGYSQPRKVKDDAGRSVPARTFSTTAQHGTTFSRQGSQLHPSGVRLSNHHHNGAGQTSHHESMGYVPKRSRILCSGPLVPQGGNIEDMLKEHERHIQEAVRMARDKPRAYTDFRS